jgi:rhamnogalacturonan endolyase
MVYNGVEYQDIPRGTQVNSGFDFLYKNISAVSVNAQVIGSEFIKITVQAGGLTHYYIARNGYPHVYMGTYFTSEPDTLGLCRYIVRIPSNLLPNGPVPSDIRNNTGAIESSDVFKLADGTTRSKHYSNMRLKDWSYIGATGTNVGVWMVRDNNEGNSGGPFYRCLLNQCGSDQEITYIVNYGEIQTEAFRTNILNTYTLVFTNGTPPPANIDTSWFGSMGMVGYIAPEARGAVNGIAINGRDPNYAYTVGFANATAQYWTTAAALDGAFLCTGMIPGTYTMTIYKNELPVDSRSVTVTGGQTFGLNAITINGDPSTTTSLWRIGDWDGTPRELLNGDKITTMHPSDVRMASWVTPPYVVGTSTPSTGFPAYQWKGVNNPLTIKFNLTADQIASYTLRAGITIAYAGGRPMAAVNSWTSSIPAAPNEPKTRSLTVGSYRGNNVIYSYTVPASALKVGENTLTLTVVSGSSGSGYLSPGCSYDAVDFSIVPPVVAGASANATWNNPFTYDVLATNQPTSYAASGLPTGLSIDTTTGVISGSPQAVGTFNVTLSAANANGTGSAKLTLTVIDTTPPVLTLPNDITAEATGANGAAVTFSASALDGVDGNVPVTFSPASGSIFPLGTSTVTATATDAAGNVATGTFTVTVRDTTPPVINSLSTSKTRLWPANHQMVAVRVSATASDAVSKVTTRIINVTSSEAVNGLGDGDTAPDWEITGDMTLNLRAERFGGGDGRTYTITVEARDEANNASTADVQVVVPHDMGNN